MQNCVCCHFFLDPFAVNFWRVHLGDLNEPKPTTCRCFQNLLHPETSFAWFWSEWAPLRVMYHAVCLHWQIARKCIWCEIPYFIFFPDRSFRKHWSQSITMTSRELMFLKHRKAMAAPCFSHTSIILGKSISDLLIRDTFLLFSFC